MMRGLGLILLGVSICASVSLFAPRLEPQHALAAILVSIIVGVLVVERGMKEF